MPSSPEDWTRWVRESLREHERGRPSENAAPPARPGSLPDLPRYEIRERVGEGASAEVYRAWDRELRRPVALKILREAAGHSEVGRQRFRREVTAAAALRHPNVVTIYDAGEQDGRLYLVLELVDGSPLNEVLKRCRAEKDLAGILEKVARGLAAAHEKGIVHRDLKPSNILLTPQGEPKVGDFGLAHLGDSAGALTRAGTPLGTPPYMAPEQVEGRPQDVTPRTDVYALGVILYEGLTGRLPHAGVTLAELYGRIVLKDPAAPRTLNRRISREIETVVLKAMEKDPHRRYPDAGALAEDLRRFAAGEPVSARRAGPAYRLYRRVRKNWMAFSLGAAAALAGTVTLLLWALGSNRLRELEVERERESARYREEREASLRMVRETARVSLDAALKLRRRGEPIEEIRRLLPPLEEAYRGAVQRAPDLAEADYIMARMLRTLMQDRRALECVERALSKDSDYAPALYERILLRSREYGEELERALVWLRELASQREAGKVPGSDEVEGARPDLRKLRERIVADCERLERALEGKGARVGPFHVTEANALAARGILAFHRREAGSARSLLERASKEDPLLEEVWETLAQCHLGDEAEAVYTEGISRDRGYIPLLLGRGRLRYFRVYEREKRNEDALPDFAAAEDDFTAAQRLDPKAATSWLWRGRVREWRGRYRMAREGDPLADFAAAEEDYTRALELDGNLADAWLWRGVTRHTRSMYFVRIGKAPLSELVAAEDDLARAVRLDSRNPAGWWWRGSVRYLRAHEDRRKGETARAVGVFEAAAEDFKEALRLTPPAKGTHIEQRLKDAHLWAARLRG